VAEFLQFTITGISVGMVYALIGLSFALIWKSSGVANLALGGLILIFSWFTYGMTVQIGLPYWSDWSPLLDWLAPGYHLCPGCGLAD